MRPIALGLIKAYRVAISPYMPGQCRFSPSCSEYAAEAITAYGVIRGSAMTANRLVRCRPGAEGGYDPAVPDAMDTAEIPGLQPATASNGIPVSSGK